MPLVLADLLDEQRLLLDLRARTRVEALREIINAMQIPQSEAFLREVVAREESSSTLMPIGVAFPHARTELVQQIVLGIGRSIAGVDFGDGARAHLLFVVAVPRRMVNDYLVCVGALARLVRKSETRAALMQSKTPHEFAELLRTGSLLLE